MDIPFSRGKTHFVMLGAAAAAAGLTGLHFAGQARQAEAQGLPAVQLAMPLATTVLTAEGFTEDDSAYNRQGRLKARETLIELVTDLGADPAEASRSLQALYDAELIDPRRVQPGFAVTAQFRDDAATARLASLSVATAPGKQVLSKRLSNGEFIPVVLEANAQPVERRISATIDTSIYEAALAKGAHDQQVVDFARVFAYDLDFQRDIHAGDTFEVVYEEYVDERGNRIRSGDVVYAEINGKALNKAYYRFTPDDDGVADYFDANGEAATKFLMKTPINGARLSSNFGYRRHPISGYNKLHKGTDFAAPSGTPVYAAGHGTVERASRYGGYGNYVRIRHANGYSTAYAHLSRYGPGMKSGKRVHQGDIIGYVGSTGASTGPHLHYEVLMKGKQVNAMTLDLPTGRKLADTPEIMAAFEARRAEIDALRAPQQILVEAEPVPVPALPSAPPAP